jgi:hypothetical protein
MVDWLTVIMVFQSVLVGLGLVAFGLFGGKPRGSVILVLLTIEVALVIQLAVSTGISLAGGRAEVSTLEFFGYLLVALLIPPAAIVWALAEPTRWSSVVMGFAALTVSVMLMRMHQIWTGIPFGS